jgi:hypothetical protein
MGRGYPAYRRKGRRNAPHSHKERAGPESTHYASCLGCRRVVAFSAGSGWYLALAERQYIRERFADLGLELPTFPGEVAGRRHPGTECGGRWKSRPGKDATGQSDVVR